MTGLPRLIATDLDGTLLRPDGTVSARTRAALDALRAHGVLVVPVTARQPRGLRLLQADAGFDGYALCGNGAHGLHLRTGEVLFEAHLSADTARALVAALHARVPDALCVSIRDAGETFVAQRGYEQLAVFSDHKRHPHDMTLTDALGVTDAPSLKLILRHATLDPRALMAEVRALGVRGFEMTHSGAPFLEVMAPGVTKAWGVAQLCTHLGFGAADVLAFGDAANDVELLTWAGTGVAMGNAHPEARAAADAVTGTNAEDGVAVYLERLLAQAGAFARA
ncbi:HAD family hydrolase [Deinococcus maricopensis]|uniref:Cof-like hydrolase n=1 Tax=Deinococcus maricopensis (strain DSM 21211 / LMG 22137 / NRRL B-23946 / LB-34) TaxID=709986 RepID=E8U755_DEIML|nr:HAD family hydrolase [Deinococcus maricopensis]ADV66894.1 Cof-like hydrolase [Deinococcus maricopensis DSM 21211]